MTRVLATSGAVTRWPDRPDHTLIRAHAHRLGGALEVMVFSSWYEDLDRVAADLGELDVPVVHAEKGLASEGFGRLAENCRFASALGATTLVLHLWDLPRSDRTLDRELALLPALADTAEAFGLVLALETTPCDFATPLTNLRLALAREPRCRLALDTEFLAMYDELEAVEDELWPYVAHLHVRDYDGSAMDDGGPRRYLLPGEGELDLAGFLARAHDLVPTATLEASAIGADGEIALEPYLDAVAWLRAALA